MLRVVLFGLVAVSASACSKSSTETSAKVVPGAAAGTVLEAKGTVTVKHGDTVRPLAVGETVLADDVLITGADGNVVIELAHNSARWELGPNKQTKVSESIAWNAKKATAQEIDEATAAAGRPAERSAAGTVAASADVDEGAPAEETKADRAPEAAAAAPDLPEPDLSSKGGTAPPPPRPPRPTRRAVAPKASPPPAPPAPADMMSSDDEPAPRRTRGGVVKAKAAESAPASAPVVSSGAAAAAPAPSGSSAAPSASSLLAAKATALHACMVTAGAKDDVTLTVDVVSGKATVKLASKAAISAALDKCLKGVVAGVHFSGSAKVTRTVKP